LDTTGGEEFLKVAQFFKLCPIVSHFSKEGEKFFKGVRRPMLRTWMLSRIILRSPWLWLHCHHAYFYIICMQQVCRYVIT